MVQAAATLGYLISYDVLFLGVFVGLAAVANRGGAAVRGPFMAAMVGRSRLVSYRARVRSVANAAMAMGAGLGGVMLGFGSPQAVGVAVGLVPLGYLLGAAISLSVSLPFAGALGRAPGAGADGPGASSLPVSRNPRFLAVVCLNAVLSVHVPLLSVAFPLWISGRTSAPDYMISSVILINTIGVVVMQVPVSVFIKTPADAARASLAAGSALALAALLLAYSGQVAGPRQVLLVIVAALLHLAGELWHSAASWELAFTLAPTDRLGEYQGAFNAGTDLSLVIGPTIFGVLVVAPGVFGWWVLAGALVLSGALMWAVVRGAPSDVSETATAQDPA